MKHFIATVSHQQWSVGSHLIEAETLDEAEQIAEQLQACDVMNLEPVDGEFEVTDVTEVEQDEVEKAHRQAENDALRRKVLIEVTGGCVVGVYCGDLSLEFAVIDHDNREETEESAKKFEEVAKLKEKLYEVQP